MEYDRDKVHDYWDRDEVESMYDKNLLNREIEIIREQIPANTKVLDAGCGEGEGTLSYSTIPGVFIHAVDFSDTRLRKAAERLNGRENVVLKQVDFLGDYHLDNDYDIIVSQRFLINLTEWELQKTVLADLGAILKLGGKLLMLEGSKQGVEQLNDFRKACALEPLPVKWHNLFFDEKLLIDFLETQGLKLIDQTGLGTYFLLTRGIRPLLDHELDWDCDFNRLAAKSELADMLGFEDKFSRLKLWVFRKERNITRS